MSEIDMGVGRTVVVPCEAGCHLLVASVLDDDGLVYLSFAVPNFYALQDSAFQRFRKRISAIWTLIRGREYEFEDIVLSQENAYALGVALIPERPQ